MVKNLKSSLLIASASVFRWKFNLNVFLSTECVSSDCPEHCSCNRTQDIGADSQSMRIKKTFDENYINKYKINTKNKT